MAEYHPTDDMLLGYASGSLSDGLSLLVASHLTYCAPCRARVAQLEGLGGALLVREEDEAVAAPSLDTVLARLGAQDVPAIRRETTRVADTVLPATLQARIGGNEREIPWKFRIPGLSEHVLESETGESVSLLRARPGVKMLSHTHHGDEATLVFSGAMRDGDRVYRAGDVAVADETDEHRPEIVGDETCYCLIVMTGSMRFTGRFGKMLNFLNG
ncbi:MAG: ChrR family anti-sigma-E factor [Pseudomonadota bacterium]